MASLQRKTRCDPGLPRCGPCERTNSHCEYFDQSKGTKIPRNYVVHLQHKVRDLERRLVELERDDLDPEPEEIVRQGARVQIQEHDESKFLGPSSGIAITRLVMQLAKQFTDSTSITDIVDQQQAAHIKEQFEKEEEKPTSKVYPLISDVAAEDLPARNLTNLLVELFNLKGNLRFFIEQYRANSWQSWPCTRSSMSKPLPKMSKMSIMDLLTPSRILLCA